MKKLLMDRSAERGNMFTLLLAGVAIASALSLALYQTVSGPMSTMVRVTNQTAATAQSQSTANAVISDAVNTTGDCDDDGSVEPRAWRAPTGPAGSFPGGGGLIPNGIGTALTDQWGTEYGYCVWDVGTSIKDAACDGGGAGDNARRFSGSPTPTAGQPVSQTVVAIISAGPNRTFDTSCRNYVDTTTDVVYATVGGAAGAGGDDIVQRQTYTQMTTSTDESLWKLKTNDSTTATIDKNLEVGPAGAPTFTFNKTSGLLSTTGRMKPDAGLSLNVAVADAVCNGMDVTSEGLIRWNSAVGGLQACVNAGPGFVGMSLDSIEDVKHDTTKYNTFVGLWAGNEGVCPGGVCPGPHGGPFANNTGVGTRAMLNTTTGNNNTALGYEALYANQTGNNNTAVGFSAGPAGVALENSVAIGSETYVINSNTWVIGKLGTKQAIKEGNPGESAAMGIASLADAGDGTATVNNTLVTQDSRIFLTINDPNGGTPGHVYISARNPGVSFTISSTSGAADTSIVAWEIKEPNCEWPIPGQCHW